MSTDTRHYAAGTELTQQYPFGTYVAGRALCADGKTRALARIAPTADTFFSVPAAVKVRGRTVSGYVTVTTMQNRTTPTEDDPAVVRFIVYRYGRNADALPEWPAPGTAERFPMHPETGEPAP